MRGETREGEEGKQAGGRADLKLEIPVFFLASWDQVFNRVTQGSSIDRT